MELNNKNITHIVVDMLYDFIDGSLACQNAREAVTESVRYINRNPLQRVVYICDSHPAGHCSFAEQGGAWPPHCVTGTHGQEIHADYYTLVTHPEQRPEGENIFKKGEDPGSEQYSGYEAANITGERVGDFIKRVTSPGKPSVVISGIATEYCISETVTDLIEAGFTVYLLKDALGYVNRDRHISVLESFKKTGVILI